MRKGWFDEDAVDAFTIELDLQGWFDETTADESAPPPSTFKAAWAQNCNVVLQ